MTRGRVEITSADNPRLKAIARLHTRRHRERENRFLIEGKREVGRALASGITLDQVVVAPDLLDDEADRVVSAMGDVRIVTVSSGALRRVSVREHPDGIVAVAQRFETTLEKLTFTNTALLLVAESIEKPGNIGAMLRTAEAAGASVLVSGAGVDLFNPNVVRASQGALFSVAVATAPTDVSLAWVAERASIVVADPAAATAHWLVDMTGPVAVVIGSEHAGVPPGWAERGRTVEIPMAGSADSLNASVAAAVLLYEAVRQRAAKAS